MACCALKKRKKQWMILPIILFILVGTLGGFLIALLSVGGLFSHNLNSRKNKAIRSYKQLEKGLMDRILNEPFLFDSATRCRVSSRLMDFSAFLAGAVYKYFNLIVFGTLAVAFFFIIQELVALKN